MRDLIKEENIELRQRMADALAYLKFMKSHGLIGPDSGGNPECRRCKTALNRAINKLTPLRRKT